MIGVGRRQRVYAYGAPVDLRKGFDGLSGHASLDAKGNVRRPLFLMQVKQGQFVPLTHVVL